MNKRQIEIRRKIIQLRSLMPSDDIIRTYSDFLKYRDILCSYRFNINAFCNLVELAYELWHSGQKLNKPSILELISKYSGLNKNIKQVDDRTARRLFWLFRETNICGVSGYSLDTINRMQSSSNKAIKGISLTNSEQVELIENINRSSHILNRILRHPKASPLITEWIKSVFLMDSYRGRRPELIGWILDEDIDYIVKEQVIIDDFEYFLHIDKELANNYIDEHSKYISILDEKKRSIDERIVRTGVTDWQDDYPWIGLTKPTLNLAKRIYNKSIELGGEPTIIVPNFENRARDFYNRVDFYLRLTMLWGIAYSHHSKGVKEKLYKKWYNPELYPAAFKIGSRTKNFQFLEWLFCKSEGKYVINTF